MKENKLDVISWLKQEGDKIEKDLKLFDDFELLTIAESIAKKYPNKWSSKQFTNTMNAEIGTYNPKDLKDYAGGVIMNNAYEEYLKQ